MRILVSGGGTGGHIYPALALIETLKKEQPESEVLYVGAERGLEKRIVPEAGIKLRTLHIQGFKRSISFENIKTVYLFLKSVHESKKIIREFKPDVVIGTGGYVCGAVVYAAARLKIPTMIHEQNSVAGITNKFLSRFVDKIGICFDDARQSFPTEKIIFTGNPRAQQVAGMTKSNRLYKEYGLKKDVPTVLIFGGSQGAKKINQASIAAIKQFANKKYQILFVTGRRHYDKIMVNPATQHLPENVFIQPYIADMPAILPEIECIVGRAGATSLAEITALGIASILIPSPYVTNDHQTKNAMSLVSKNAAKMITEEELNGQLLVKEIDDLMSNTIEREKIATNCKQVGVPDAASRVLNVLDSLVNG